MHVPVYDLQLEYKSLKNSIDRAVQDVLESGVYVLGAQLKEFEKEFAEFCGSRYVVGVNSGTAAIQLALRAAGIGTGDEVITAPNTDISTASAVSHCGARVVFADIDKCTLTISPMEIEHRITSRTKAILPVHLFGQVADMSAIRAIADKHDLIVVEDAALAVGAEYNGDIAGTLGDVGCVSFAPGKILGGIGQGGAVICDSVDIAHAVLSLRNYGKEYRSDEIQQNFARAKLTKFVYEGYNQRLDEIQAAFLRVKLSVLDDAIERRLKIARDYFQSLEGLDITLPCAINNRRHVFRAYTILVKDRDGLARYLESNDIGAVIYYAPPLHLQGAFAYLGYKKGDFPVAEYASANMLSIPIYPTMTDAQVEYVIEKIRHYID